MTGQEETGFPGEDWLFWTAAGGFAVCHENESTLGNLGERWMSIERAQSLFRPANDAELARVVAAFASLKALWDATYHPKHNPDFGATFDGALADVAALDWLLHEQLGEPDCGIEGVALICGEVIRRAAGLQWMVTAQGVWFVAQPDYPHALFCPLTRLQEIRAADCPQFGKHLWFLQAIAFALLSDVDASREPALREILDYDSNYMDDVARRLRRLNRD